MIDIEKFLVFLRSNKDLDGKLKPIYLADTVQEEIKIIQAAVKNSCREWVGLTKEDMPDGDNPMFDTNEFYAGMAWAQTKLKEKNT